MKIAIKTFILIILIFSTGCSNANDISPEKESTEHILNQYKENSEFGGFISEPLKMDMYSTNWFARTNLFLHHQNDIDQEILKEFLSELDILKIYNDEDYNFTMTSKPIFILSFLDLSSQLNIQVDEQTKKNITTELKSRQDPKTGYFKSNSDDMSDALFTTLSIEILTLLDEEILHSEKLIKTIKEEKNETYLFRVLLLLKKDISEDLLQKIQKKNKENGTIDNLEKLDLAYTLKKELSHMSTSEIDLSWQQIKEPKTLYQVIYLTDGELPIETKEKVEELLNNRKAEIGWGIGSELSVFYTYLGVNILKNTDSLEQINQLKIKSFLSSKINDFYYISIVNKEKLELYELQDLLNIIKKSKNDSFLSEKIYEILEVQLNLYNKEEFTPTIGTLIESVLMSNNEHLLTEYEYISNTKIKLDEIKQIKDLYSYTLQSYGDGKISEKRRVEILEKLKTFNSDQDLFYSTELTKKSSIEGLYQAFTITTLLSEELPNQKAILNSIESNIISEKNFIRLGLLSIMRNSLKEY